MMTMQLAAAIEQYFHISNGSDPTGVAACFTTDAVVLDEGGHHQGHAAIKTWFFETRQKYAFQAKPLSCTSQQAHQLVVAEVSGNFPGSPIQLGYKFLLQAGKIQRLEIS